MVFQAQQNIDLFSYLLIAYWVLMCDYVAPFPSTQLETHLQSVVFSFWEHLNPKKSTSLTNANVKVYSFMKS